MLILTGCLLYVSDRMLPGKKMLGGMTMFDALIIGLCQSVATIPGLSRTAVTITAGTAVGLRRDVAVNYSFLLSIPRFSLSWTRCVMGSTGPLCRPILSARRWPS